MKLIVVGARGVTRDLLADSESAGRSPSSIPTQTASQSPGRSATSMGSRGTALPGWCSIGPASATPMLLSQRR